MENIKKQNKMPRVVNWVYTFLDELRWNFDVHIKRLLQVANLVGSFRARFPIYTLNPFYFFGVEHSIFRIFSLLPYRR